MERRVGERCWYSRAIASPSQHCAATCRTKLLRSCCPHLMGLIQKPLLGGQEGAGRGAR